MSTAATAESTPPERPQITLPCLTCARIFSIASSRNARMVQSPRQPAIFRTKLRLGAAELAVMPALDGAAELVRHDLLAVADAQYRHARLVDRHRRQRRVLLVHRGRPSRQDHGLGP